MLTGQRPALTAVRGHCRQALPDTPPMLHAATAPARLQRVPRRRATHTASPPPAMSQHRSGCLGERRPMPARWPARVAGERPAFRLPMPVHGESPTVHAGSWLACSWGMGRTWPRRCAMLRVGGAGLALRRAEGRRDCTGRREPGAACAAARQTGAVLRRMDSCTDSVFTPAVVYVVHGADEKGFPGGLVGP